MRKLFFLACLFAIAAVALPPAVNAGDFDMSQIYTIDSGHSYLGFQVKYMGFAKVRGRMTDFSGTIRFDENDLTKTSITVRIAVESINTEHDTRDKDLKSANWFDAETYPEIGFQSKRAVASGDGFDLVGDLTIRGVTREVRLEMNEFSGVIKDIRDDTQIIWTGTTVIDRKEFGVAGERWSAIKEGITGVESEVLIELTILGKRINAPNFRNRVRNPERPQGKIYKTLGESGLDAALSEYDAMRAADTEEELGAWCLNVVGHMLLKEDRADDAITVFKRNAELYPEDGDLYDSLGEAYAYKGDFKNARANYNIALEMNPRNVKAVEILRHLH